MRTIATTIAAAMLVLTMSACDKGDPCDAQPNPHKAEVCKGEK